MQSTAVSTRTMSGKFEWRTEDEEYWQRHDRGPDPAPARRRRFLSRKLLFLLLLLLLTAGFGTRQILLRAQETNRQIESDILAAHHFMLQAVIDRDMERLSLALAPGEIQWQSLHRANLRKDLLYDRGPLGLWLDDDAVRRLPQEEAPSGPLLLSPDLATAELTATLPYLTQRPDGSLQPLALLRTFHYSYDGRQWRLQPPPEDRWGPWEQLGTRYLTLDYPAKDRELSRALADQLDAHLAALCDAGPLLQCPPDLHVSLALETGDKAFAPLSRPVQGYEFWNYRSRESLDSRVRLSLPAPTLVGLPGSAAGRQFLLDGYAGWLLTAIFKDLRPDLTFDQLAAILAARGLQLPSPVGYDPQLAAGDPPLPDASILLSCTEQERPGPQWAYDLRQKQWASLGEGRCPGCLHAPGPHADQLSPGGRYRLVYELSQGAVVLQDAAGRPLIRLSGTGRSAWLDENSFALISTEPRLYLDQERYPSAPPPTVTIVHLDGDAVARTQQISVDQLLAALPPGRSIKNLQIEHVLPRGSSGDQLLILARNGVHENFLFNLDVPRRALSLVSHWADNGLAAGAMQLTDNGRHLTVERYNSRNTYIILVDLQTGDRAIKALHKRPQSLPAWSADEQWLLFADDRLIWLHSPEQDITYPIPHTHAGCTAVAWAQN